MQLLRSPVRGKRAAVAPGEPLLQVRERVGDRDLGERGHGRGDFRERGEAAEVARDYAQHDALAQFAQRPCEGVIIRRRPRLQETAHFAGTERLRNSRIQPEGRLGLEQPPRVAAQARGAPDVRVGGSPGSRVM